MGGLGWNVEQSSGPDLDHPVNCFYTLNNTSMHFKIIHKKVGGS